MDEKLPSSGASRLGWSVLKGEGANSAGIMLLFIDLFVVFLKCA